MPLIQPGSPQAKRIMLAIMYGVPVALIGVGVVLLVTSPSPLGWLPLGLGVVNLIAVPFQLRRWARVDGSTPTGSAE